MRGSLHRLATSEYDQGRAEASLRIERLTLVLKPSDTQAAELDGLLGELRYPKSRNYHQWLTPELYADRFGLSDADIEKITDWLTAQNLSVTGVSRAHNAIMASGRVERVEEAFQTEIHMYAVAGEMHYANATEPTLPSALEGIVVAIHGLHNFRLRPRSRMIDRCSRRSLRASDVAKRVLPGLAPQRPRDVGAQRQAPPYSLRFRQNLRHGEAAEQTGDRRFPLQCCDRRPKPDRSVAPGEVSPSI